MRLYSYLFVQYFKTRQGHPVTLVVIFMHLHVTRIEFFELWLTILSSSLWWTYVCARQCIASSSLLRNKDYPSKERKGPYNRNSRLTLGNGIPCFCFILQNLYLAINVKSSKLKSAWGLKTKAESYRKKIWWHTSIKLLVN